MAKLSELSGVTIQTLVSSGHEGNLKYQNIAEWIKRLNRIKPLSVQLYTLDRPHPASDLTPATQEELNQLKARVQKESIPIEVFNRKGSRLNI